MRIFLCLLVLLAGCSRKKGEESVTDRKVAEHIDHYLSDISSFASGLKDSLSDPEFLIQLYEQRDHDPFWFHRHRLKPVGDSLIMYMNNAHLFGLNSSYYRVRSLQSIRDRKIPKDSAAYYDILLTDAFMKFMTEVHAGKIDPETRRIVYKGKQLRYYLKAMIGTASKKNQITRLLHAFEPPHHFYRQLKEKLFKLAVLRNELYELASRRNLSESDTVFVNPHIREFARLSREVPELIQDPAEFTDLPGKINYLKENLFKKEAYINTALEKWRWQQRVTDKTYVFVNIASYNLYFFDLGNIVFSSKIVVGKPENKTPELESQISSVLLYPRWHVPYSIASKEILPLIQSDMEYLVKQNMEVLDKDENVVDPDEVEWEEYNEKNLPFRFRQREGEGNALGVIKFYFPNRYGVYMHDTNEKRYFAKKLRAYSHGCMRVEKPKEFAGYLLKRGDTLGAEIDRLLSKRQSKTLTLQSPVKLYVKYFTAEVVNDTLHFYPDIYKKEQDIFHFYAL